MENKVYELLEKLDIKYEIIEHPPLFTCEDNEKYNLDFDAVICKNLFIKNSNKSQYYLLVLPIEKRSDLKILQNLLGETRLSFGDEDALNEKLGTKKGSVSIFNVINIEKTDVIFVIDEDILNYEKVAFHPNINTLTVTFNPKEVSKILEFFDIKYNFIKI